MTARTLSPLLLLAGLSLSFVLIASRPPETVDEEQATRVERSEPPVDSGRDIHAGYYALVRGGQMYAGTVLSATVTRSGPAWPGAPPREWGVFRFRVDRVVVGPEVRELTLGYWWLDDNHPALLLSADWLCNDGPWRERPRAGQHFLLLLEGNKWDADQLTQRFGGPVSHVWRGVGADHPLVQGFADAVRFLAAKETKTQHQLFHKFCQSPFPSLRQFAFQAAFFAIDPQERRTVFGGTYNPRRQTQLILQYLRDAVPRISDEEERYAFTTGLSAWFRSPRAQAPAYQAPEVAGPLRAAFENWYLTELGAVDRPKSRRCWWAVVGLEQLINTRGTADTLALFPKGGRAALEERLRACARAQDEEIQEKSRKILEKLDKK